MKHKIIIEIERELSQEEKDYLKRISEKEVLLINEEQKEEIISYFESQDIKENEIKKLEIIFGE